MASIKGMLAVTAVALSAACFMGASPAFADDEDDAREACERIAENRNWKDIDTDVQREGDDRIVITVQGEREGEDRNRRCVYNTKTNEARFEDQRN